MLDNKDRQKRLEANRYSKRHTQDQPKRRNQSSLTLFHCSLPFRPEAACRQA